MLSYSTLKRLLWSLSFLLMGSFPAAADWQADWQALVVAANKEGILQLSVPAGRVWREQILSFQKAFPAIKVEATPGASRDFIPRFIKERQAGQYLWDVRVGGFDGLIFGQKMQGAMQPIRPALVLPEVVNDSSWLGGLDGLFIDREKEYFAAFIIYASDSIYYSRKAIPDGVDIKNLDDDLWKGKISIASPRGGASLVALGVMQKVYGEAYVRRLLADQNMVVANQARQQIDWLGSGRYPIAFGLPSAALVEYAQQGGAIDDYLPAAGFRIWSCGVGGLQLITNAPHPNAAKVFINWILSRDVQAQIAQAVQLNSRRVDVSPGAPDRLIEAKEIDKYFAGQSEESQPYQERALQLVQEYLQ